jgi:Predicted membrane protein (DUF2157)
MSKTNHIKWLYNELPELVAKGILPEGAATQLKNHYGEIDEKPAYNIAIILAAILGAILIGGGIILLFAHNWDHLVKFCAAGDGTNHLWLCFFQKKQGNGDGRILSCFPDADAGRLHCTHQSDLSHPGRL